jgi:putative ABC transport system permease protein
MIWQDIRYGIRGLRSRPGFTSVAVLTLSLGIGANAAVFSVVNGVLLQPLPYREPARLVHLWETNPNMNWTHATVAPANLLDWKARSRSFEDFAHYMGSDTKRPGTSSLTLTGRGDPERVRGMLVSANFFDVLGAPPALGRTFRPAEELPGRTRVVVLSDAFWTRRFGRDPAILGTQIEVNGAAFEVAGVMPRRFHVPGSDPDFWTPRVFNEAQARQMRRPHVVRVIARLKPGVTIPQAQDEMTRIAADLEREYPDTNTKMGVGLGPLHEWFVGDVRSALLALMGTVALVLLVACTNVASLLLARATSRRRELAIRVALGAGRARLVRQLLAESLALSVAGAAAGLGMAWMALQLLQRVGPAGVPRLDQVSIDWTVLAFVTLTACATTLVFGIGPGWTSASGAAAGPLKDGTRGTTAGGTGLRRGLIVVEVALSVVLLVAAGLLLRSFDRLRSVDPGIDSTRAVSFRTNVPGQRYDTDDKVASFYSSAVDRLRALPGVRAAGATARMALEGYAWTGDLFIDGQPDVWGRELRHKSITPGYFEAAGLPLLRGRDFNSRDTASGLPVAIVNEALVKRYFPDANPIGQRIAFGRPSASTRWRTIVGVVSDEKQDGLASGTQPEVYDPHTQDGSNTMAFVVRTSSDPVVRVPEFRQAIAGIDPAVAIYDIKTLEEVVSGSLAEERFTTMLLGAFAAIGLVLAAVGLYGIVAFTVTERTREIGVRLALGATRGGVLRMVVWEGLRVVLAGLTLGVITAFATTRAVEGFLFQTAPGDPLVLAAVVGLLGIVGVLASCAPAFRASRVDPAISLRAE